MPTTLPFRAMALRFHCGSCSQPIEVDDEWASRAVACPYCRNTVTAPAESTITDVSQVPLASPLAADEETTAQPIPPFAEVAKVHRRNRIAAVALGLACGAAAQFVFVGILFAPHRLEMEAIQERVTSLQQEGTGSLAAMQQAGMEFYENYGGVPPGWMIAAVLFEMGGALMWIAALVCALIALRRPERRRLSVTALVVTGLVPVLLCCGGLGFGS